MYLNFYGLAERPFELTANPRFLFFSARHREALTNLEFGLSSAKAITILLGPAGTGKTTLLRGALQSERCRSVRCIPVMNPTLTPPELLDTLGDRLGLGRSGSRSKSVFLWRLETVLRERRAAGEIVALVVDEAQSVSLELLEEIRLLTNIETPDEKLLPLVLVGQPEFGDRLNDAGLQRFKQRVALRCEIGPLDLQETAAYIGKRVRTAGGEAPQIFTREAVSEIYQHSGGIPRTINVICDNALISGFALGRTPVDRDVIIDVCRDFDFRRTEAPGGQAQSKEQPFFARPEPPRVVAVPPVRPTEPALQLPQKEPSSFAQTDPSRVAAASPIHSTEPAPQVPRKEPSSVVPAEPPPMAVTSPGRLTEPAAQAEAEEDRPHQRRFSVLGL